LRRGEDVLGVLVLVLVLGLYDFNNLLHHPPANRATRLFLPEFLTTRITTYLDKRKMHALVNIKEEQLEE